MFKYTIDVIVKLISMMLILGMMFSYVKMSYEKKGQKIFQIGIIAGIAAAAVMSFMKNATNKIDTSYWNFRIFLISLIGFAAWIVFTALGKKMGKGKDILASAALTLVAFMLLFYCLPDFIAYPYSLYVSETTVFTSSYIIKLGGVILGFILVLVAGFAANRGAAKLSKNTVFLFILLTLGVNEFKQVTLLFNIMISKRMIESNHILFNLVKFGNNYSNLFIYLVLIITAIISVILCVRSAHVNEPYANPAEHRKIKAKWRNIRRWAAAAFITTALAIFFMTAVDSIVNKAVELSPTEDAEERDGAIYVSFDQVSDGHLHRFGYTTENGVQVRFIVIQKPDSTAYGVGMDACDICGETGYYEKNGQVVCNRCDVVMNINTIGFKGGCNPKVIEYTVEDGYIIVPTEGLEAYESDFA